MRRAGEPSVLLMSACGGPLAAGASMRHSAMSAVAASSAAGGSAPADSGVQPFVFPPMHAFPPLFTLQANPRTAQAQIDTWTRLVLAYCEHERRFVLDAYGDWERTSPLFCNKVIDRALSPDTIRTVFAHMVQQGRAVYDPPLPRGAKPPLLERIAAGPRTNAQSAAAAAAAPTYGKGGATANEDASRILVYWRTPDEWGEELYTWVRDTGQNKGILTVYELAHGDFAQRLGIREFPLQLLRYAIDTLTRKGRAQLFRGTEGGLERADPWSGGVKFA